MVFLSGSEAVEVFYHYFISIAVGDSIIKMQVLKTGSELRCSRRVGSSCSTSDTCRVTLVISHEREKNLQVLTASGNIAEILLKVALNTITLTL
jgi:hypothetical protein